MWYRTAAVVALDDLAVVGKAGVGETLQVVVGARGPAPTQGTARRDVANGEPDSELAVKVALEIDNDHDIIGAHGLGLGVYLC